MLKFLRREPERMPCNGGGGDTDTVAPHQGLRGLQLWKLKEAGMESPQSLAGSAALRAPGV